MSTEHNKALVDRITEEGLNQHNPALVDELCAPDFVFHNGSQTIQGLPAYKRFLAQFFTAFPDAQFTTDVNRYGDLACSKRQVRRSMEQRRRSGPAATTGRDPCAVWWRLSCRSCHRHRSDLSCEKDAQVIRMNNLGGD